MQFMANCVLLHFKSSSYLLINLQGVGNAVLIKHRIDYWQWLALGQAVGHAAGSLCWRAVASPGAVPACRLCHMKDAPVCLGWHLLLGKPRLGDGNCEYRKLGKYFQFQKESAWN